MGDLPARATFRGVRGEPIVHRFNRDGHDPGIVLLSAARWAIDLGAVPGPTQDVSAVPVPGGQQLLLSVATW